MKVYVLEKSILLSGKSWEIQQKLKEYQKHYHFVNEWITAVHPNKAKQIR